MSLEITSHASGQQIRGASSRDFLSPFDGSVIGKVFEASMIDLIQALAPAKKAQSEAESVDNLERSKWLSAIAGRIRENEQEFALLEATFEGLSQDFVLRKSIRPMIRLFESLAAELKTTPALERKASGLVSIIAPASLAFRSIGERLAPAIAAGNAVFVKVPSKSPVSANLWAKALVDLPPGLVSLWVGSGKELGGLLSSHPSIHAVSFAGSPQTAKAVIAVAAPALKKVQVSAGVKNSLLLLPEFDLAHLPQALEGALAGQGRLGWNLSRIFVTEPKAAEVLEAIKKIIADLVPLTSPAEKSLWAPSMVPAAVWDKMMSMAKVDHARDIAGGDIQGRFLRPKVVADLTNCSELQLDELQAPLLIVNSVKYTHEMAKWTNTGDFGFCASIWGPADKAEKLGGKLDVGQVWINGWLDNDKPFAGWRKSFFGNPDFWWSGSFYSDVKTLIPN